PDVEFGPIREWKHAHRLAFVDASVVEPPELRPLSLRIPLLTGAAEREHALLGARSLFVAPCTGNRGVETVRLHGLLERFGLHDLGVVGGAVIERIDAPAPALSVGMNDEIEA